MTGEARAIGELGSLFDAASREEPSLDRLVQAALLPEDAAGPLDPSAVVLGGRFLFLVDSERPPTVALDGTPPVPMRRVAGGDRWFHLAELPLGRTHNYLMEVDGVPLGAFPGSVAGYGPASYPRPGVPAGSLVQLPAIASAIYGGAESRCWVYANAGLDEERGAPVMVWLDGERCVGSADVTGLRLQTVTDNLVHDQRIPPMVHVLLSPGTGGSLRPEVPPGLTAASAMRSLQYDTVSDELGRHLLEEVLPEVGRRFPLRPDGYSSAVAGQSSGGIAAFKVCWFANDRFTRAHSTIGSYTALQWRPEEHLDGGYIFPFLVRREPRRNIRVWLSDGMNDMDLDVAYSRGRAGRAGSWPLANLQMAQALKASLYDFHFRYGEAFHNSAQAALDLPESLAWLWRGYDPARDRETYEQDPEERAKPPYRVQVVNRDAW